MKKTNKKSKMLVALSLLLVVAMGMGTIAWLTKTDTVTNTFTVGQITEPEEGPEGSNVPEEPENPFNPDEVENIYEPSWKPDDEHKVVPGGEYNKDPFVGVGAGSEASEVYVYVENGFTNKVYFEIEEGWEAVEGKTEAGFKEGTYTSGLFKYTAGLDASESETAVWTTTPLFDTVIVDDAATATDLDVENKEITVSCYIHQKYDADGETVEISPDDIINTFTE